ncbi:hypothetical protein PV405_34910 [Streptomyces sp. ME02-6979-3A]|uniref:hypothetical protein n=1 Tax=Streptomyces sp. ME02-6979-3A TaxID=3028673 RepID=UPI0029B5A314|nr:hypothetical protein [Streptomyces sp. ME02-6979-3A]MDX3329781.1 hypothetical protein [Streptomyces sp. ME02-6979-3A]
MSDWNEQRRLNRAADAEEQRKTEAARAELVRKQREAEDRRRRDERIKDRDEKRAEKVQRRRERTQRRQTRAAKREKNLTPENVYRKGTLLLVGLSAAASLPAQILHFVAISWMLFPIGPAVEGAAWVMAAGVAYADERKLAGWVRWLLRVLSLSAAGFAANINYQYGTSLTASGLSASEAQVAGIGLAAVTLGGPLFFEVRQWVLTLSAKTATPKQQAEEKARAKHENNRGKAFKEVTKRQRELLLAAPFGTLSPEDAFDRAWWDVMGAPRGVTANVIADRLDAEADVSAVLAAAECSPERAAVELLLADLFGSSDGDGGASGALNGTPIGDAPGGAAKSRTALGGKGKRPVRSAAATAPMKPLAEADLNAVRKLAEALGGPDRLSARNVREAVGCRNDYALRLRDAIRTENEGETP